MNRELHSGETKAPKPQSAAHPAAALSWAIDNREALITFRFGSKRDTEERKMERGAKLKST